MSPLFNKPVDIWKTSPVLRALQSGTNNLVNNKDRIDALNVFPVPDGDTGSNMSATLNYAINELKKASPEDLNSLGKILKLFARGMLFGARGNSGVIFSQIIKGFSSVYENVDKIDPFSIVRAFKAGTEVAYKSVLKPVEGTILTVVKEIANALATKITFNSSMMEVMELITRTAKIAVESTPNLLAVLKEVGVVDSGGEGFYQFLEGIRLSLEGKDVKVVEASKDKFNRHSFINSEETFDGDFGYCTEFIVEIRKPKSFDKLKFQDAISKHGDSIVLIQDDEILKVHIHTKKPGKLLDLAQKKGEFVKLKCENMVIQANQNKASQISETVPITAKNKSIVPSKKTNELSTKKAPIAIVSVASGKGIQNDFHEFPNVVVIEGGQTMNPSAIEIIDAIKSVEAKSVLVLPNNSNVILACQQAAKTITDKKVIVIPSKNVMQGLAAMYHFDITATLVENKREMIEAIKEITTGSITLCTRDTKINKVSVKKNEFIGIVNGTIIGSYAKKTEAGIHVVKKLIKKDSEILTIYYGSEATETDAREIADAFESKHDIETEIKFGGQKVYYFYFSVI